MVELAGREPRNIVRAVVVVVMPFRVAHETRDVLAEAIVHDRVHLVARQPLAGVGPDLADQRAIDVVVLGVGAVVNPPCVREVTVVGYIKAPSVRALAVPVLRDVARAAVEEIFHRGDWCGRKLAGCRIRPSPDSLLYCTARCCR